MFPLTAAAGGKNREDMTAVFPFWNTFYTPKDVLYPAGHGPSRHNLANFIFAVLPSPTAALAH